jgi:hypothetical protein
MAQFAKIINGTVIEIIIAQPEFFDTFEDPIPGEWVETSIGYIHDEENKIFYSTQPFPSWSLNQTTGLWEPPVVYPTDEKSYMWDETTVSWKKV